MSNEVMVKDKHGNVYHCQKVRPSEEEMKKIADKLYELQAKENEGRGVTHIRTIVTFLRRGDYDLAFNTYSIEGGQDVYVSEPEGVLEGTYGLSDARSPELSGMVLLKGIAMKYGVREFLFLWSESIRHGWDWPRMLHEWTYNPRTDNWEDGKARIKVTREGDASIGTLMARGISRKTIDKKVAEVVKQWEDEE